MKISGDLVITKENQKDFKKLTEVSGYIYVYEGATLTAPALTKSGYIYVYEGATLTAPALTKSGYIYVYEGATLTAPALTEVSGYIDVRQGATLTAPALTKSGSVYVRQGATLTAPALKYKDEVLTFNRKDHSVIRLDGMQFVVSNEKTSKGIKIYEGYHRIFILDGKVQTEKSYLVEKEGFSAHGETLKKAIEDLQFKITAEKLRKEPIYLDTVMTDNYYRLVTGACELGVKTWKQQNGIEVSEIKVSELLPLLQRTNAYGYEKLKTLIKDK